MFYVALDSTKNVQPSKTKNAAQSTTMLGRTNASLLMLPCPPACAEKWPKRSWKQSKSATHLFRASKSTKNSQKSLRKSFFATFASEASYVYLNFRAKKIVFHCGDFRRFCCIIPIYLRKLLLTSLANLQNETFLVIFKHCDIWKLVFV